MQFKTVAIDYDDTYTLNPKLFESIAQFFALHEFEVLIVTYRPTSVPIECVTTIPVHYTDGRAKDKFMRSLGINIDVWIDDSPITVVQDREGL